MTECLPSAICVCQVSCDPPAHTNNSNSLWSSTLHPGLSPDVFVSPQTSEPLNVTRRSSFYRLASEPTSHPACPLQSASTGQKLLESSWPTHLQHVLRPFLGALQPCPAVIVPALMAEVWMQVAMFVVLTYATGLLWLINGFWLAALLPIFSLPFATLLLVQALGPVLQRSGPSLLRLSGAFGLCFGFLLGLGLAGHSRQQQLALLLR